MPFTAVYKNSGWPGPLLPRATTLYLFHYCCVETDTAMEQEVPPTGHAEPDARYSAPVERVEEPAGGFHRVVGYSDDASEHVGAATREYCESGVGTGEPIGGFVERSIPTEHDPRRLPLRWLRPLARRSA